MRLPRSWTSNQKRNLSPAEIQPRIQNALPQKPNPFQPRDNYVEVITKLMRERELLERGLAAKESPLPLVFHTEPIVGWRVWSLRPYVTRDRRTEHRLVPVTNAGGRTHYAPYKRTEAVCSRAYHDAPHRFCACGIWAMKSEDQLPTVYQHSVYGEVYLWGRVLEGKNGYRAQYAYPKRLWADDDAIEELRMLYGVPVERAKPFSFDLSKWVPPAPVPRPIPQPSPYSPSTWQTSGTWMLSPSPWVSTTSGSNGYNISGSWST